MSANYSSLRARVSAIQDLLTKFDSPNYPKGAVQRVVEAIRVAVTAIESDISKGVVKKPGDVVIRAERVSIYEQLLSTLDGASFTDAPTWVAPLLELGTNALQLKSPLLSSNVVLSAGGFWGTAPLAKLIAKLKTPPLGLPPDIRIFLFPKSVETRPQSVVVLFHEIGHAWCDENDVQINEAMKLVDADITAATAAEWGHTPKIGDPDFFEWAAARDDLRLVVRNQLIELTCDDLAMHVMGPAFDFEQIATLSDAAKSLAGLEHPKPRTRIDMALQRLAAFAGTFDKALSLSSPNGLSKVVDELNQVFASDKSLYAPSSPQQRWCALAEPIALKAFAELGKLKPYADLLASLGGVSGELVQHYELLRECLDDFIPPFELIDRGKSQSLPCPVDVALNAAIIYELIDAASGRNVALPADVLGTDKERSRRITYTVALAGHVRKCVELGQLVSRAMSLGAWDKGGNSQTFNRRYLPPMTSAPTQASTAAKAENAPLGPPDRLIVTPLLAMSQVSASAIDLRLGSDFLVPIPHQYSSLEPRSPELLKHLKVPAQPFPAQSHFRQVRLPIGDTFVLHPHQFVLGCTLEYLRMPDRSYGLVMGRSSWGRLGLVIATASVVQHGFRGALTLELRNLGEAPIRIPIGARIAQITLVRGEADGSYLQEGAPKYVGPVEPQVPKIQADADWELLKAIVPEAP